MLGGSENESNCSRDSGAWCAMADEPDTGKWSAVQVIIDNVAIPSGAAARRCDAELGDFVDDCSRACTYCDVLTKEWVGPVGKEMCVNCVYAPTFRSLKKVGKLMKKNLKRKRAEEIECYEHRYHYCEGEMIKEFRENRFTVPKDVTPAQRHEIYYDKSVNYRNKMFWHWKLLDLIPEYPERRYTCVCPRCYAYRSRLLAVQAEDKVKVVPDGDAVF